MKPKPIEKDVVRRGVVEDVRAPVPALVAGRCLLCAAESGDLICETCSAHIQGEAIERKYRGERSGRRG